MSATAYPLLVALAVVFGGLYVVTDSPLVLGMTVAVCVIVIVWSAIGLFRRTS